MYIYIFGIPSLVRRCLILSFFAAVSLRVSAAQSRSWNLDDIKQSSSGNPLPAVSDRRPSSMVSWDYVSLVADDTKYILTSPLRWDREDWLLAGGLTSLVAVSSTLDGQIREESQEHRTKTLNAFTKNAQRFGAENSWIVLGAFEAYGYFANDQKSKAVAMDGVTASIIASGIVTPLLKFSVGRVRPNAADRTFEFKPFSGSYSFPSGHTTQAFAVASVIASHYDQWWVQGLSYGVAGLVGYSRIQQNSHYASDVVVGAVIGTLVGRTIVKRHNQPKEGGFKMTPYLQAGGGGVMFSKNF